MASDQTGLFDIDEQQELVNYIYVYTQNYEPVMTAQFQDQFARVAVPENRLQFL